MLAWEKLEAKVKELFKLDNAKTVPGSGNGKGEEDVIGLSTIIQCKYTDNKNMSILDKDMKRLRSAAELQDKLPIFINENQSGMVLSIPEGPLMGDIVNIIIALAAMNKIEEDLELCKDIRTYNMMSKFISNDLKALVSNTDIALKHRYKHIRDRLDVIYGKLTQCDLFDEHH